MKTAFSIAALMIAGTFAVPAIAADEYNTVPGLTAAGAPLGFHGVDPVAFIEIGNRIDGTAKYTAVHDGVAYYFSSQENMNAFRRSPAKYAPAYGGFCTFGVSVGKKFDGDPQFADVRNGKLYVFLNEEIFRMYQKDKDGAIAKAEKNWMKIQHKSSREL
ncbi:MAG: YHS domain-containing protein [Parvularculaceae bacterium]|nr:YHS domain-containing protein [Parvularculaceae bacterium]